MNKQELRAIMLIVTKLGWNDMPAFVAIDAIQKMVNNDIAVGADCCNVIEDPEDSLLSISSWNAYKIWMTLFISDYQTLNDIVLEHWVAINKCKIEAHMKKGHSFEESCNMPDIPSIEEERKHYQEYLDEMQEAYNETIVSLKYCF